MTEPPAGATGATTSLHLLGPFRVRVSGHLVRVPAGGARVLAYLALTDTASRSEVAGTLWPEITQSRANSDLRTTLWRLHIAGIGFLDQNGPTLALADDVAVDVRHAIEWATGMVRLAANQPNPPTPPPGCERDLLPDWNDAWLAPHRERLRILTLQAFELAAQRLLSAGRPAQALPYLLHVTGSDPLRESAQYLLLELHLRQHNVHEALRLYQRYRRLVLRELDIEPGIDIRSLIAHYLPRQNSGPAIDQAADRGQPPR